MKRFVVIDLLQLFYKERQIKSKVYRELIFDLIQFYEKSINCPGWIVNRLFKLGLQQ